MREYFGQANVQLRDSTDEQEPMLRGYDPLREMYHWQLIFSFSQIGIVVVGYILSPGMNNLSFLDADSWSLPFFGFLVLLLIFGSASVLYWGLWRHQRETKLRTTLRRSALNENNLPCLPIQHTSFHGLALPLRIESHLQKDLSLWIIAGALFVVGDAFLNYAIYNHLWGIWYSFVGFGILPSLCVFYIGLGIFLGIQRRITKQYLFPWLDIDNEGITARYGRDTISMRWNDICYFALTSTILPLRIKTANLQKYETFEISDGENMICWQVAPPPRSYGLLQNGEVPLSSHSYTLFTQQLASLIVERTGLPLYDFRVPERKTKRSKRKEQAQKRA